MRQERPRVAVVGSGISGLTSAHLLQTEYEVTLIEAAARIGGHSNTVRVDDPRGEVSVDTGFIVHNERNYPLFTALLDELGIPTQPTRMGMSISSPEGSFEFANTKRGLFAQRSNLLRPRFWRLIRDALRFNREVRPLAGRPDAPTVGDFLRDSGYSEWFIERAIAPEISAVWSADPEAIWNFPLGFLAEFLENHGQLQLRGRPQWRTIGGGSHAYVWRLADSLCGEIHVNAPVRAISRTPAGVAVETDGFGTELFDEVVIATHSDQALAMLAEPTAAEREILGALPYRDNEAVLHTDSSLMPRRRAAWAGWNFHLGAARGAGTQVTYWMNELQRLDAGRDYFVTLNRLEAIDPARVIAAIPYAHPQVTDAAVAAQRRWNEISGRDGVHYCGAYWRWGFHEDGCWSAHRACAPLLARASRVRPALALAA